MEAHNKQSPYDVNLSQTRPTPAETNYVPAKHFYNRSENSKFTLQDIHGEKFTFKYSPITKKITISTNGLTPDMKIEFGVVARVNPQELKWCAKTKKNGKVYLSLKWDDHSNFFPKFREADNGQQIDQYKLFFGLATRKREFYLPKSEEPPHWAMMRHLEL